VLNELGRKVTLDMEEPCNLSVLRDIKAVDWCFHLYSDWPGKVVKGEELGRLMEGNGDVIFEGAQGVLLDETHGYQMPHVTWTDTTPRNAMKLLNEAGWRGNVRRIGCVRRYFTRHGAGPFPTEDNSLRDFIHEPHNGDGGFQGRFRVGHFDADLLQRSLYICEQVKAPIQEFAVSHLDECSRAGFKWHNPSIIPIPENSRNFIRRLEACFSIPVTLTAFGPTALQRFSRQEVKATA